jgi:hypothetical protein
MDMRFGMWDVWSLYWVGSLMTVSRELSKYKLDFVGVQVRWEGSGTGSAGEYTFFYHHQRHQSQHHGHSQQHTSMANTASITKWMRQQYEIDFRHMSEK